MDNARIFEVNCRECDTNNALSYWIDQRGNSPKVDNSQHVTQFPLYVKEICGCPPLQLWKVQLEYWVSTNFLCQPLLLQIWEVHNSQPEYPLIWKCSGIQEKGTINSRYVLSNKRCKQLVFRMHIFCNKTWPTYCFRFGHF